MTLPTALPVLLSLPLTGLAGTIWKTEGMINTSDSEGRNKNLQYLFTCLIIGINFETLTVNMQDISTKT
jgi:hypothetical protein